MDRLQLAVAAAFTGLALAAAAPQRAQQASAAPQPATPEPKVQRNVIEDEGSRIEELRVRGQLQRVVVTPKVGTRQSYEIITGDGSRDLSDGANTSRGAAGKRVWHVLSF
jgi:hypothetical protein